MPTVTSKDGTSIAYDRVGHGPALIMVDAAGGFRGFGPMESMAAALESEFTVVTYDRRGRGDSTDTLPYAVEREVEDIAALIEVAGGSASVHGFSSGAVLALTAAIHGLPILKLALLEPPLPLAGPDPSEPDLGEEIAMLVADDRRGEAIEYFNRSIGVPEDMIAGLRDSAVWPSLEALAHTLVYDSTITGTFPVDRLATVTTPALVVNSDATDERLLGWGRDLADALPDGTHRTLAGEWHGVAPWVLAPVLAEFYSR